MTLQQIIQTAFTLIIVLWLFLILWFLWRQAAQEKVHVQQLYLLLSENTTKSADAAKETCAVAMKAVEVSARLVSMLEEDRKRA